MCNAGQYVCVYVCVFVCVCVCASLGFPVNARLLDINRNNAWKDRVHGCIGGT